MAVFCPCSRSAVRTLRSLKMARPERFELPTTKFVAWYSIQLSYGRAVKTSAFVADLPKQKAPKREAELFRLRAQSSILFSEKFHLDVSLCSWRTQRFGCSGFVWTSGWLMKPPATRATSRTKKAAKGRPFCAALNRSTISKSALRCRITHLCSCIATRRRRRRCG